MVIYESPQMSETLEEVEGITMNEREQIVQRLSDVTLGGGSHESLSAIAKAILPGVSCWTYNDCDHLRRYLVNLISMNDGEYVRGFDEGFASADDFLADNNDALEEHGYIHLPFKPGDDVEHDDGRRGVVKRVTVQLIGESASKSVLVAWGGGNGTLWADANKLHPYHKPTVEDVLYDSLKHFGAVEERTPEVDSWVCEQAAKLRKMLVGDAE